LCGLLCCVGVLGVSVGFVGGSDVGDEGLVDVLGGGVVFFGFWWGPVVLEDVDGSEVSGYCAYVVFVVECFGGVGGVDLGDVLAVVGGDSAVGGDDGAGVCLDADDGAHTVWGV